MGGRQPTMKVVQTAVPAKAEQRSPAEHKAEQGWTSAGPTDPKIPADTESPEGSSSESPEPVAELMMPLESAVSLPPMAPGSLPPVKVAGAAKSRAQAIADGESIPPATRKGSFGNAPRTKTFVGLPSFTEPQAPIFEQGQGLHPRFQALKEDEDYRHAAELDRLRPTNYSQLQAQAHTYLDFTGGGLTCQCQLKRLFDFLQGHVLGNPHSINPTSNAASKLESDARHAIRTFFNVPDDYAVIFSPNASGALRLVGESYTFGPGIPFVLSADNHNSVGGIREFARGKGSTVTYVPLNDDLTLNEDELERILHSKPAAQQGLFAFPAQSNVSGVKHPLTYIIAAKELGWDVLLDASAFVPTSPLDVTKWQPDFACMSFYKMFGFPTGIGCLIMRHKAAERLQRPWFGGGTVALVTAETQFHILRPEPKALHSRFEDGTINYHLLPGVTIGLEFLSHKMPHLKYRLFAILKYVIPAMKELKHPRTGRPLCRVFGPGPDPDMETRRRGATIVFNLFDAEGKGIYYGLVERLAAERGISLRTGCFCNPGCMEKVLGRTKAVLEEQERRWAEIKAAGDRTGVYDIAGLARGLIAPEDQGAVRVRPGPGGGRGGGHAPQISFGITSNVMDVSRLFYFLEEFLDETFVATQRAEFAKAQEAAAHQPHAGGAGH